MSVDTWDVVTARMRDIQQDIEGTKKAYSFKETPAKLMATPCFTNFPGEAQYVPPNTEANRAITGGSGSVIEVRDYEMELWAAPINGPADLAAQAKNLQAFVKRVKDKFHGRPQLEGLAVEGQGGCLSAYLVADTGPVQAGYGGKDYAMVGFTLRVTFIEKITYGGGD